MIKLLAVWHGHMRADFEVNTTRELLAYGWQICVALCFSVGQLQRTALRARWSATKFGVSCCAWFDSHLPVAHG